MILPKINEILEEDFAYKSSVSKRIFKEIIETVLYFLQLKELPIGSYLNVFCSPTIVNEQTSSEWIIADGRDITNTELGARLILEGIATGSAYAPDLRGMASIGINNGRSDGKQNTVSPSLGLGDFMEGGVKSHSHSISTFAIMRGYGNGIYGRDSGGSQEIVLSESGQTQNTVNSIGSTVMIKVGKAL